MVKLTSMTPLLNVEDAVRSVDFYRDVLGFEVANQMEFDGTLRWARIQAGSIRLMINQSDGPVCSYRQASPVRPQPPSGVPARTFRCR